MHAALQAPKDALKALLLKNGVYINKLASHTDLTHFFNMISPVTTNHELIRLGGEKDGAYVVPNDLKDLKACFSPGVCDSADFELSMAERNIPSFMADYSVEKAPLENPLFTFEKKFLGLTNDDIFMTLESWMDRCAPKEGDLVLQMNIEGAEYDIILDTPRTHLQRYRLLIIEFHQLEHMYQELGLKLVKNCFNKLLKDFEIVHIHPNNYQKPFCAQGFEIPSVMEFTFLRKDRVKNKKPATTFPHPLDVPNFTDRADPPLPTCWYKR